MRAAILMTFVALIGSCGGIVPAPSAALTTDYTLHVVNATTLAVGVRVNDGVVGIVAPKTDGAYGPTSLPPLPWRVTVETLSGRTLIEMDVEPGSVQSGIGPNGESVHAAPGSRVDLSCGRLDVYVGVMRMGGPAPGPGQPGDCDP